MCAGAALNSECAQLPWDQLESRVLHAAAPARAKQMPGCLQGYFYFCGETMGTQPGPSVPHLLEEQAWGRQYPGGKLVLVTLRISEEWCGAWLGSRVKGRMKAQVQGSHPCGFDLGERGLFRSIHPTWATGFLNTDRCCVPVSSVSPQKPSD